MWLLEEKATDNYDAILKLRREAKRMAEQSVQGSSAVSPRDTNEFSFTSAFLSPICF